MQMISHMSMNNSNRCDEILVLNGTGKQWE